VQEVGAGALQEKVVQRLQHLSAFGRGPCGTSYAAAKVLYPAEFQPLPANVRLQQVLAAFTFDNTVPGAGQTRTGPHASTLASSLFAVRPRDGGFGVLPIRSHMCQVGPRRW
jgi:hypothetical protein